MKQKKNLHLEKTGKFKTSGKCCFVTYQCFIIFCSYKISLDDIHLKFIMFPLAKLVWLQPMFFSDS